MDKNSDNVNERVKNKLKDIIKKYPNGLWCCDLPEKYSDVHKTELDYRDFGYTSLIELILELPEIFRCYQPALSDWLLFDASSPVSNEEKEIQINIQKRLRENIPSSVKTQLVKLLQPFTDIGVKMEEIPKLYYKKHGKKLYFEFYGFEDLNSFFTSLEGDLVHLRKAGSNIYVIPLETENKVFHNEDVENFNVLGEAIPPILPGDDLFVELFPKNVFGPNESIPTLQLEKYLEVGSRIEIVVADVWSPHKFYVQLKEFNDRLTALTNNLENFYLEKSDQYKMPEVTVQPKQICGVFFQTKNVIEKWHRAEIVKIRNKKISVRLMDFGSVLQVKQCHLRFLPRKFGDLPSLAIPASLANLEPSNLDKKWMESTNVRFLELVSGPLMLMEVVEVDYEEPRIILKLWEASVKSKTVNISKALIKEGLAVHSEHVLNFCRREKSVKTKHHEKETKEPEEVKEVNQEFIRPRRKKPSAPSIGVVSPILQDPTPQNPETRNPSSEAINPSNPSSNLTFEPKDPPLNLTPEPNKGNDSQTQPEPQISLTSIPSSSDNDALLQYIELLQLSQMQVQKNFMDMIQQQALIEKKQINNLAVHFFTTNDDIKNIAQYNPEMALKLATNLAEDYYKNMKSTISFQNVASTAAATATAFASSTANVPVDFEQSNDLSDKLLPLNIKETNSDVNKRKVREIDIEEHKLHIVTIRNEEFVSVDQLIRNFTSFSTRTNVDKILAFKKIKFDYEILTRFENESLFDELESYNSFKLGDDDEEEVLVLLSLKEVPAFLNSVNTKKESTKAVFFKLLENFK